MGGWEKKEGQEELSLRRNHFCFNFTHGAHNNVILARTGFSDGERWRGRIGPPS